MKKIKYIMMLLLFSVISATAQEPQNIKDNSFWVYRFDYHWFIKKWDGDCRYSERFTVIGKSEKNGKLYFTLQFIRISEETDSGSSSSYFHDDDEIYMYHIITLQKGQAYNQISIREEKGQFLVDKDEYMTALNDENYGGKVGNPDYVPYEMTEDNELILYDFTKREGDIYAYSQEGEPITVTSVEPDLQGRRLLELPRKGVYIRDGRKLLVK